MSKFSEKNQFFKKLKNIKHIEIYIAIIFIVILIAIYFVDFNKSSGTSTTTASASYTAYEYANYVEDKLEKVLSNIKNAGKVSVMVSIESGSEIIYATTSEEKTNTVSSGSTSTVVSEPVIVTNKGNSQPIIIKEYMPKINGVIVVAEGANNISVRLELLKAVEAILNVPTTNIEILVGKK